jgi:hypothetical protein
MARVRRLSIATTSPQNNIINRKQTKSTAEQRRGLCSPELLLKGEFAKLVWLSYFID